MDRISSETRSFRNGLSTHLSSAGWTDLDFSEGWDEVDITNPLVNIYVYDTRGREQIDMGEGTNNLLFPRSIQVDTYMESEQRVRAINQDIADYMDTASITIRDYATTSGVGYMVCPNSALIMSDLFPPELNDPEILRWRGIVRGEFESFYPNGGSPV